jgi:hypothetical protein
MKARISMIATGSLTSAFEEPVCALRDRNLYMMGKFPDYGSMNCGYHVWQKLCDNLVEAKEQENLKGYHILFNEGL